MKNLFVLLLALFLLGSMPKDNWDKGSTEQQTTLLKALAERFAPTIKCTEGKIIAVEVDGNVNIYFNCEQFYKLQQL